MSPPKPGKPKKQDGPDPKDWEANARLVPASQWAALAETIRQGDIAFQALLAGRNGSPVVRACLHHPEGVPPQLAAHGIVLLRDGTGSAANFAGTYTTL